MSENDFMVAIQAVLMQALRDGWPVERIVDAAHEAIQEFEDEEARKEDENDGQA